MIGTQMPSYPFSIFMHLFQILCACDSNYQNLRHSLKVFPKTIDMFPPTCREPEFLGAPISLANDGWLCKNEGSTYLFGVGADSKVQYTQGYILWHAAGNCTLVWFLHLLSNSHHFLTSFSWDPFLPCTWILLGKINRGRKQASPLAWFQ